MIIVAMYNFKVSFGGGKNPICITKNDLEEVYIRNGMTAIATTKDYNGNVQVIVGMPSSNDKQFINALDRLGSIISQYKVKQIKWCIEDIHLDYAKDFVSKFEGLNASYSIQKSEVFNLYVYSLNPIADSNLKEIDKMLSRKMNSKIFSCNFESDNSIKEYAKSRGYEYECADINSFIKKNSTEKGVLFIGEKKNFMELYNKCFEFKIQCRFIGKKE